jgi:hypothetical protein
MDFCPHSNSRKEISAAFFPLLLPADVTLFAVPDLCKCGMVELLNDDLTQDHNKQELT